MEIDPDLIPTTSSCRVKRDVEDIQGQYALGSANVAHNCKPRAQNLSFISEIDLLVVENHRELKQRVEKVKDGSKGIHVVQAMYLFNEMRISILLSQVPEKIFNLIEMKEFFDLRVKFVLTPQRLAVRTSRHLHQVVHVHFARRDHPAEDVDERAVNRRKKEH